MLLHNILIYFFFSLHFVLHPPLSLSLSAISFSPLSHFLALFFSQNFLSFFSNFSLKFFYFSSQIFFLLNFFFAVWGPLLLPCGCGGSSASWSCCGYGRSSISSHAVGVGLCHGVHGSCCGGSSVSWFRGSCWECGVVGHQHCGHAMGVVGHQFRVMPWVWVAVGFIFVVVGWFSWAIVGCVKWWLTGGGGGLHEVVVNCWWWLWLWLLFIIVDILFYCNRYIILMCCLCYFIVLKVKIKPLMLGIL